jgi:DNA ligase-1
LDQTTRTNEKVEALKIYFQEAPPADAAWALQFLCGRNLPRAVPTRLLWQLIADETQLPAWLIAECFDAAGDMAETLALLIPYPGQGLSLSLSEIVEQRLIPLGTLPELARRSLLRQTWRDLNSAQRLVWNKLVTGNFRIGVARTLVIRALAAVAEVEPSVMAHRVMGSWRPTAEDFARLMSRENEGAEIAKPYPFFLASPLEIKIKRGGNLADLGPIQDWYAEWKWDGIRAQLIRRGNDVLIWSRGDEMVTDTFPEIAEAGRALAVGTVLDGEILAWDGDHPLPFGKLQRRLGRKTVAAKMRSDFPVAFVAYDLLEFNGADIRNDSLQNRRTQLERIIGEFTAQSSTNQLRPSQHPLETALLPGFEMEDRSVNNPSAPASIPLRLSPLIEAGSWEELAALQAEARAHGVEGIMLKNKLSIYGVGRQRGDWWKWKIDPFVIDAVLISAQPGHGRRASLYTDYTFGLWEKGNLVPIAKAYSGLTDEEILQVDAFVRRNTTGKFGAVCTVKPVQVFEIAFEGIQKSTRHKCGIAVRFPRMNRWRRDKKPEEADTLDNLRALLEKYSG